MLVCGPGLGISIAAGGCRRPAVKSKEAEGRVLVAFSFHVQLIYCTMYY